MFKKEKFTKMLDEKRQQEKNLNAAMIDCESKEERSKIGATLVKLREEIADVEEIIEEMDKPADNGNDDVKTKIVVEGNDDTVKDGSDDNNRSFKSVATVRNNGARVDVEARAKEFAKNNAMSIKNSEARSVLVSSGSIATPTEVSGINDMFNQVSSIVDLVKVTDASGMGAYKVAFQLTDATAATQTEGQTYNSSDPTFGYTTITPETIAVLSYISKQVQKQSPLNYEGKVRESALWALRKQASIKIINAILTEAAKESGALVDTDSTSITDIDAASLRTIAMSYGGDENVFGGAWLFLNKKDLVKFGDVRSTTTLQPAYEITPDTNNPNTGIIKDGGLSVRYCICSDLTENTMIYGQPTNCELALFSDYDIRVSEDFAFDQGLLAIRGDVELGAGVVKDGGFIKFVATPST